MAGLPCLSSSERGFRKLSQFAAWIFGIIGVFLLPPPIGSESDIIVKFAKFVLIVATGLVLVPARRWNPRRAWIVTVNSLVLSITLFFMYQYLVASWTCTPFDVPVVVASDENLTDLAREYRAQNPNLTCELLLQAFAGNAEVVWSRQALITRRFRLALVYLLLVPLLAICVIALLQAVGERRRTKAGS
jgi:hypothetical protein